MTGITRETRLISTFVALADTLVAEYDVLDLLDTLVHSCVDVLGATAVGLLLADEHDELSVVATTSERSRLVELMQLSSGAGPCLDCFATGAVVSVPDIAESGASWPAFRSEAIEQGLLSVHAIPMRLRGTVIGALNIFGDEPGALSPEDVSVAQGLADIATIGILHEREMRESTIARDQLQYALDSRVVIEQAKGVLSQLHDVEMDVAFRTLRSYARSHSLSLRSVSEQVVGRTLTIERPGTP